MKITEFLDQLESLRRTRGDMEIVGSDREGNLIPLEQFWMPWAPEGKEYIVVGPDENCDCELL